MASPAKDRALRAIQNEILEMIAYGEPLAVVADTLCRRIEDIAPETICSVLTVDKTGRIHPLAAPRLPDHYSAAIDGLVVGPLEGSCGRAAALGESVLVEDISSDPLWAKYKALALPIGLRACWSTPIKARRGKVIGTFALYYRTNRGPDALERLAVDTCVHLCAIAIEQAEAHARVQQLAYFDTLTGLSNRSHAEMVMKEKLQEPDGLGLLLIDIDNLKITNDTLGHAFGDELIKQVAARIAATTRPGTACRIGGDEFLVILDGCQKPGALKDAAERVLASMETPFTYEGRTIVPHVTIGGALHGRDGLDSDTLRQNADLALYHSKETGRGRFFEFNDSLRIAMTRRIQTIRDLETALNDGRIVTHYQPIVRLDTGDIIGLEALARLRNSEGQIIAAAYFQDALKERRVARRLTDVILEQVAADVRSWLDMGIPFQHAGINVTTADFQGEELADRITAAFGKKGVPLNHVVLEVTETVFFGGSDSLVSESVKRLRSRGLRVALDDFGTGYASLTHLQTFPVDVIKIDKCFVDRLVGDPTGEVIVAALIDIARKLGMRTVAEGVETEAQAKRLHELGCTLGQGFWFYRPASFQETTERLLDRAQWVGKEGEADARRRRSVA